jgi:GNAT superfamily N-acetyltransferase
MLTITSLKEDHLEDAAALVTTRYKALRKQILDLPNRYTEEATLLPHLREIMSASRTGVAALRGDRLVGFLTGWQMPSFRGIRSTYSPEWANAADLEDSPRIYEEMYSHLAQIWVEDQYVAHYISLFPNDTGALQAWNWLGFGLMAVDGLRSLEVIPANDVDVHIRRAGLGDLELVMNLQESLWQYMKESPVLLLTPLRARDYYEEWLNNPDKVVWLAYQNGEPVAFMRLGPADEEVCLIIQDEKTTSIYAAFTEAKARREGVATALLNHALAHAKAAGYVRCAVSYEPMNVLGSRFWLKHFNSVCLSAVRHIDERIVQK